MHPLSTRSAPPPARLLPAAAAAALACLVSLPALGADELPIGAAGPDFHLRGTDGKTYSLDSVAGLKGTAIIFTCNQCPYSRGYEDRLIDLANAFQPEGIHFIAINPNDPARVPGDAFEQMVARAEEKGFPYPYVVDETQEVAAAYGARVTPHVFLLDADGRLAYRGRVDDSLEENDVTSRDFRAALEALAAGKQVPVSETRAFGCSVKWSRKRS
ncbi:MAG: thioredoxin family protein [Acidobacteriota bacterium]